MSYANLAEMMLLDGQKPKRKHWRTWVLEEDMKLLGHIIHRGFMTDFASIPRPFRSVFSSTSAPWQRAAVLHDYLYSSTVIDRAYCDKAYYYQARSDGTAKWEAQLQYTALRWFGWLAFRKNRKQLEGLPFWRFLDL